MFYHYDCAGEIHGGCVVVVENMLCSRIHSPYKIDTRTDVERRHTISILFSVLCVPQLIIIIRFSKPILAKMQSMHHVSTLQ